MCALIMWQTVLCFTPLFPHNYIAHLHPCHGLLVIKEKVYFLKYNLGLAMSLAVSSGMLADMI